MNISESVVKWRQVELTERSASQQHFLDLCELFDHPKPAAADRTSATITQEVARRVGEVAQGLRKRGVEGTQVARFLH